MCKLIERKERSRQTRQFPHLSQSLSLIPYPDPAAAAADQTLCLLNLKRFASSGPKWGGGKTVQGERKTQSFFFLFLLSLPFTVFFFVIRLCVSYCLGGSAWASGRCLGSPGSPGSPSAARLLIQDNKCLSLGFRQLFTLS